MRPFLDAMRPFLGGLTSCPSPPLLQLWVIGGETFQKQNDLYFQNAVWFMLVTSLTIG
jgi:hypothetical protein